MRAEPSGRYFPRTPVRDASRSSHRILPGTLALVVTLTCHLGCYAPPGSYEPYPAYGQPCIPPPPTGAIGTPPGGYYYPGYYPYGYPPSSPYTGGYPSQPLQPIAPLSSAPSTTSQTYLGPGQGNWQTARNNNLSPGLSGSTFSNERQRETSSGTRGNSLVWTSPRNINVAPATWDQTPYLVSPQAPQVSTAPYFAPYDEPQAGIGVAAAPGPFVYSNPNGASYGSPIVPSVVR